MASAKIAAALIGAAQLLPTWSALRQSIRATPSLEFLAGFCYTQLTDIEQEINGLLTYDRKPKVSPEAIAAIHEEMFRKH